MRPTHGGFMGIHNASCMFPATRQNQANTSIITIYYYVAFRREKKKHMQTVRTTWDPEQQENVWNNPPQTSYLHHGLQ